MTRNESRPGRSTSKHAAILREKARALELINNVQVKRIRRDHFRRKVGGVLIWVLAKMITQIQQFGFVLRCVGGATLAAAKLTVVGYK